MTDAATRLADVFKAYDVRGRSPEQLDSAMAFAIGWAFADVMGISHGRGRAVVGRDMRRSSPDLAVALVDGITRRGGDVLDIGLASTDLLYFASGRHDLPGVMITASHNGPADNGMKFCRPGARPVSADTGLNDLQDGALAVMSGPAGADASRAGVVRTDDLRADYAAHLLSLVPPPRRRLKVAVDAGNGMAGHTVPVVFSGLDVDLVPVWFELDGRFPNHLANPLDPATLVDVQDTVRRTGADLGLAFDGDADRCFVIDERGDAVSPSAITALIATRELTREPGATIIHNLITSRAVAELVRESGGRPVRTPVGHSFIKAQMAEHGAIFGGEHSGHFYFRDFWFADSGMLAALHVISALAEQPAPLSHLMHTFARYPASGEINSTVADTAAALARVEGAYADDAEVEVDRLDGVSLTHPRWTANIRPSNTEPLLRLNVEADDTETLERIRDHLLAQIRRDA